MGKQARSGIQQKLDTTQRWTKPARSSREQSSLWSKATRTALCESRWNSKCGTREKVRKDNLYPDDCCNTHLRALSGLPDCHLRKALGNLENVLPIDWQDLIIPSTGEWKRNRSSQTLLVEGQVLQKAN